ncbi:hypothetical protein M3I53_19770 [Paraburkholderia sp. CNPSo 3272]|uniref:hypothetical protein n=1 Tax=Paraburkholderia sp. CNPSo 3272 TaxID=2940931 RepID=UPI0020B85FED|nr:hypothetical protein [Paraburkholderia sp. CNPSo 3272]MCP3725334.1 hypothetical protein [Paraburkholderia sp. CNPSo 3272]
MARTRRPLQRGNSIIVKSGLIAGNFARLKSSLPMKLYEHDHSLIARVHYCYIQRLLLREIAIIKPMIFGVLCGARRRPSRGTRAGAGARIR